MGILDAPGRRVQTQIAMPSTFATLWGATYAFTAYLTAPDRAGRKTGRIGLDPLAAYNAATTAYTAPANTYYVSISGGNDFTGTGASGAPFQSIWKAIEAANTSGSPAKIYIDGSTTEYNRNYGFSYGSGGGSSLVPSVDICFVIRNGTVRVGTHLGNGQVGTTAYSFAFDATYTNCQISTNAAGGGGNLAPGSLDKITDRINVSGHGCDTELINVATPAIANVTPNSWAYDGTNKVYINRADRRAVTYATTRLVPAVNALRITTPKNIAIIPATPGDSLVLEGGITGTLNMIFASPSGTDKVCYFKNVTFRSPGGIVNTGDQRAVSIDSANGLTVFENCTAEDGMSDGFNVHNNNAATKVRVVTINCTGRGNGKYGNASCNGHTGHDNNVLLVDIAGWYDKNNGGSMAYVGDCKVWAAGSTVTEDYGDVHLGAGTYGPTGVYTRDTAEVWMDTCDVLGRDGTDALSTKTSTAKIHLRTGTCTIRGNQGGLGTVDTY